MLKRLRIESGAKTSIPSLSTCSVPHPKSQSVCRPLWMGSRQGLSRINVTKDDTTRPAPEQANPSLPKPASSQEPSSIPSSGSATRKAVMQACLQTSLFMSLAGLCLRAAASRVVEELRLADSFAASRLLSNEIEWWHGVPILLLVAFITGGRLALLRFWPSYKTASDQSNQMVLPSLKEQDVLLVSFLPGFSEELLFRGALVPALGGTEIAVLLAALLFGVLHVGGGRNAAFAVWAVFVGFAYGGAYLYTNDLLVPALAHSIANYVSASVWLQSRRQQEL